MSLSTDFLIHQDSRTYEKDFIDYCSERFLCNLQEGKSIENHNLLMKEIIKLIKNYSDVLDALDAFAFELEHLRAKMNHKKRPKKGKQ